MTISSDLAIIIDGVMKSYGERKALNNCSFSVKKGEFFALLGPNGGGKSTLFKILSTLITPDAGRVLITGSDLLKESAAIRSKIGIVFQSPSLDGKLTVKENLICGGALYGLSGKKLSLLIDNSLERLHLTDRMHDRVESLSGGLQRRTEIAKVLLTRPEILLLDEPSTGLDPAARIELWKFLTDLRAEEKLTLLCTTHLMEEASKADRVGIINEGTMVAVGAPHDLISELKGDILTLSIKENPAYILEILETEFGLKGMIIEGEIRLEHPDAYSLTATISSRLSNQLQGIRVARPTLEDLFIARTGKNF